MFAKIINNIVIKYPYNTSEDHLLTSFPEGASYPEFDAYWVHQTTFINPDPANFNAVETTPAFNPETNQWEQSWSYIEKSTEQKRLAKYNPNGFLQAMFVNASFGQWMGNFPPFQTAGFVSSTTNAKMDNDWSVVQGIYNSFKALVSPSIDSINEWQEIADVNGIPLVF